MGEERPAGRVDPQFRAVRFAAFELDVRAGELRKHGVKIRLQEQPFQVLLMLLERPGQVVLREEIRKKLWPNDTIVEFAPSINAAIQRLRDALGDSADQPCYVETVARRGYRFIGQLTREEPALEPPEPPDDESPLPDTSDLMGHTLSHYRVYEKLGRGGMGEVYRARDTKLGRDVALKVLPEEFARDADRMVRFEREAQVLASLNHPNIAAIYGVEEANGIRALVMELVEGPTLAERINRGALPLDDALGIARQMADALAAAHGKGIVHRDLKPANVKVTPEGVVKVLDFGLATVMQEATPVDDPENSPTRTATLSQAGVILGTAAYMAPEQARGEAVDKRADIWAFGVVLYEMLTGRRLFEGETTTEILSKVLTKEPDWQRGPAKVQRLLRRCLEKDPKRRLRDIGETSFLLEDSPQLENLRLSKLPWAMAAVFALIALATFAYFRRPAEEPRLLKLSVLPPGNATFARYSHSTVSPDGRRLAFVATAEGKDTLWVRDLDSLAARALPGTEGAFNPFWSPDSRFVAFFAKGKLMKIDVAGHSTQSLCSAAAESTFGSWSKRDIIVFTQPYNGTLLRVPADGGNPTPATVLDHGLEETGHLFPWFLPDGRHFLYTAANKDQKKVAVYVGDLDSNIRRRVLAANSTVYAPPGYLLFVSTHTLMAQPFDAGKIRTTGEPVPIAEEEVHDGPFSVSQNGVLVYRSITHPILQPTWFDRSGRAVGTVGTPGVMQYPQVSKDGSRVVLVRPDPETGSTSLWLNDLKRGTESRFTFSDNSFSPEWSPDGRHITYSSHRDGVTKLYLKATSGTAPEEALDESAYPNDWSSDGRYILEGVEDPKTNLDVRILPLFGDRKPFPYLQAEFNEILPKLSPNGRWLAYASDETGRFEIYVQTFPKPGGKWQISSNGGSVPTWSLDGKELLFAGADGKLMTVEVKSGDAKFEPSVPKPLFQMPVDGGMERLASYFFDVSKDGRFLIPVPVEKAGGAPITVVVNWTAGLKK